MRNNEPTLSWLAGFDLHEHSVVVEQALDQHLQASAAALMGVEPRGYYLGVIENQQIVGAQQVGQGAEHVVPELACGRQAQQPRRAALRIRITRDQLLGQLEAKICWAEILGHGLIVW